MNDCTASVDSTAARNVTEPKTTAAVPISQIIAQISFDQMIEPRVTGRVSVR